MVKLEVMDKLTALIAAAFGLVAALAWNNAIQTLFVRIFGPTPNQLLAMMGYAVVVTIIAVLVTVWVGRITNRIKEREEKKKKK